MPNGFRQNRQADNRAAQHGTRGGPTPAAKLITKLKRLKPDAPNVTNGPAGAFDRAVRTCVDQPDKRTPIPEPISGNPREPEPKRRSGPCQNGRV